MKRIAKVISLIIIILITSSMSLRRIDYREGMHKNVCKDFKNDMLFYFIFVDSKETMPWTEFDMQSTLDSIKIAVRWLQKQAEINNIPVKIKTNYYVGSPFSTIKKNLPQGSIKETLKTLGLKKGFNELNSWADNIAKKVGTTLNITPKDGIPDIKNPKDKERLIAFLRDDNSVESVALVFMVNNYFKEDISVTVNTMTTDDIEFAIVSYKYPSEIAHNILALYGAAPIFKSVFRKNEKKIAFADKEFPNDIMTEPYAKNIWDLNMGAYTKYLIGWNSNLDIKYNHLLTDNIINF